MKYVNPYQLLATLNGGPLPDFERNTLLLVRKKAFAELELAGAHLEVDSHTYSKNDLLQLFDSLQDGSQLQYHAAISQDPVLLQFLEDGTIKGNHFRKAALYDDPGFLDFVSPYFEGVYTPLVLKSINDRETRVLTDLRPKTLLMNGEYQARSFERIQRPLQHIIDRVDEVKNTFLRNKAAMGNIGIAAFPSEALELGSIYTVAIFNLLPDEGFADIRDDYAVAVYNLLAATTNTDMRRTIETLSNLRQLKVGDNRRQEIENRYQYLYNFQERATARGVGAPPRSSGGGLRGGGIVFAVIFILRLLLMLSHCK